MFVICIIKQTTVHVRVKLKEQLAFPMLYGQVLVPNVVSYALIVLDMLLSLHILLA